MKLTKQELVEMIKEELDNIPLLLNEAWYSGIDLENLRGIEGPKRKPRYKGLTGGRGRYYRGRDEGPITAANIEQKLGPGSAQGELSDRLKAELGGTKDINVALDLVNQLSMGDYDELSLGALADAALSTTGLSFLGPAARYGAKVAPKFARKAVTAIGRGDPGLTSAIRSGPSTVKRVTQKAIQTRPGQAVQKFAARPDVQRGAKGAEEAYKTVEDIQGIEGGLSVMGQPKAIPAWATAAAAAARAGAAPAPTSVAQAPTTTRPAVKTSAAHWRPEEPTA